MSRRLAVVAEYFERLGLEYEVAQIYFALYTKGPQTISELSRSSKVERTRIYRLLDLMQRNSLIEVEVSYKKQILKAVPINNLQILLSKKEQELVRLQQDLPNIERLLHEGMINSTGTRIQFYHGPDGAKQILWNETKATTEVLAILYENIQIKTAEKFFDRWVQRCNEQDLNFRGVISDGFLRSQYHWYSNHVNEMLKNWDARYVEARTFAIDHSTIIYDNVVAYYSWKDSEIFGIEIYNQEIADGQRKFFEMLWERGGQLPEL